MKKIIARILACIMFLSTLQGGQILWAATGNAQEFEVSRKMLQENSTGLSEAERDETAGETALIKWDISETEKYILTYYIEAESGSQTVTKKVDIEVENLDKTNLQLDIKTSTNNTKDENHYLERLFDNSSHTWGYSKEGNKGPEEEITKTLKIGSEQSREEQEYNVELTDISMKLEGNVRENLKLKFKVSGNYLMIYTNGIAKGNITPFELRYGDDTSTEPVAEGEMFNGPKDYTITPTHLYMENGELKNLTTIKDITKVKPGSVSGIKVSFAQVKELYKDKTNHVEAFKYVHQVDNANPKITLQLGTRYTLGSMTNTIRLDFIPKVNESVKINLNKDIENAVGIDNSDNTVSIYLSQNELETVSSQNPIIWDALDISTIVDGSFQYGDQAVKYWPANKGYTYLSYSFNKTSSNQVQLNIQPYNINSTATYSIYILEDEDTKLSSPQVVYEYDPRKTDTDSITAIVPAGSPCYFKVVVSIDNNTFESQMVYYHPDKYPAVPEVTQIKSIDNVYVVPNEDSNLTNAQPQAIGFDIEWLAPDNVETLLNGNKLYYELLLRKDKDDYDPISKTSDLTEDIYATYSKIFEVSLENGKVVVKIVAGTAGGENEATPELRYNQTSGSFTMESVSLMNYDESSDGWEQIEIAKSHLTTTSENYLLSVQGKEKNNLSNRLVPGTYYVSFRTVLVSDTAGTPIVYSEESNMVALTLDNSKEIIPVPSTIIAKDTTDSDHSVISEQITINHVDIRNYVKKMLEPAHLKLYTDEEQTIGRFSGTYEIYLYQESSQLAQTIEKVEKGSITPIEVTHEGVINLLDNEEYIDKLRKGEVIPIILKASSLIGDGNQNFEIKGLDENEVYYMKIRVKLSPWRNSIDEISSDEIPARYSLFSKEITFTTTATPVPPSAEDKVPPAPEKIWVEQQKSNTTATIGWAPANFEPDADITKTYYELIRTQLQLTNAEKDKDIEELVAEDKTRVGFRSDHPTENNPYMSTYLSVAKGWINLEPSQESSLFKLTDDMLYPNTIYYYYVRTVCIIDGSPVKSTWIMVPVTTSPVGMPTNLKVELDKDYNHDTKDEIVISFDAPVPSDSSVPSDYDFDIAVQGEMDDGYSTTRYKVTKLTSKEDTSLTPEGYTHFVYKITGLKPNKRYFIKVRVVDKTSDLTDGNEYPTSLYCDAVSTRTEYGEEEDTKDNKFEQYIKKFEQEAEKLKKKPYWTIESETFYKYRESYMTSDIGLNKEYELVVEDDLEATYYLPASIFAKANESSTTLKIILGHYSAHIRPYTLTEENDEIAEAIELISEGRLKDYYVELSFALNHTSDSINGQKAITPRMTIDMHLVYLKEKDSVIESDIISALDQLIVSEKEDVVELLEKKIYNGNISDDVLQEIIDEAIEDIETAHIKKVKRMIDAETKKTITINEIEKGILLLCKTDTYAADAYYLSGKSWVSVESYRALNGFAIEATRLGTYLLTGEQSLINTVPSLAPYQSFIAKYNLTDFFTLDSYMIRVATTKEQLYGSIARILGAPRGADYYTYLQNKKIKGLSSLGRQNAVRQDEEIYMIMQAYEMLYNRPVKSIVIKNRQSVQNIGAFQSIYRDYVYAAVELKIVTPINAKVLPSKQMTVEETITMLYKMQAR